MNRQTVVQRDHGDAHAEKEGLQGDDGNVQARDGFPDLEEKILQGQCRQRPGDGVSPQHGGDAEDGDQAEHGHRDADHAGHVQDIEGVDPLELQGFDLIEHLHVTRFDRHCRGGPENHDERRDERSELADKQGHGNPSQVVLGRHVRELKDHHAAEQKRNGDHDPQGLDGREIDLLDDDPGPQHATRLGVDDDLAQDPVEEGRLVRIAVQPNPRLPAQEPHEIPHRNGLPQMPASFVNAVKL